MEQENKTLTYDRREMIKFLSLAAGYTLTIGATSAIMSGCKADTATTGFAAKTFSTDEMLMLEKATERIWPKTNTPGANDALVHRYIDEAVTNNWKPEDRDKFKAGLVTIDDTARSKYKKKFVDLDENGQDDVLKMLAEKMKSGNKDDYSIFKELRSLTIAGFASSEVGATKFFVHNPVPGPYRGCVPLSEIGGTLYQ